jgi:hypothetical protein
MGVDKRKEGIPCTPAHRMERKSRASARSGSHKQLVHKSDSHEFTWAFHHGDEIGPKLLSRTAKSTGLAPENI